MSDPVLWPLDDHTRAKHLVLRSYLSAWLPVMGHTATKTVARRTDPPGLLLVEVLARVREQADVELSPTEV